MSFKTLNVISIWSWILGDEKSKQKLSSLTIEGVAEYIRQGKAKNIIFMVGAGISTSAGIPDFRSPGNSFVIMLLVLLPISCGV